MRRSFIKYPKTKIKIDKFCIIVNNLKIMKENDFENILVKYPDLIEDGLILLGRQVTIYERRIDLLFEDQFKRKLIVELKAGPIKDQHIGQILSYEGLMLSHDDPTIRVMLIGTRVPPNLQKSLDHHGIAWKELSLSHLKDFLIQKSDNQFIQLFEDISDTFTKKTIGIIHKNNIVDKTAQKNKESEKKQEKIILVEGVTNIIQQTNPDIHVSFYKPCILSVPSGIGKLLIQLWIKNDLSAYVGVYASSDQRAKRILLSVFNQNEEFIKNLTGRSFIISNDNRSADCAWIESQLIYDKSKLLYEQANLFASEYMKVIKTFRELISKVK